MSPQLLVECWGRYYYYLSLLASFFGRGEEKSGLMIETDSPEYHVLDEGNPAVTNVCLFLVGLFDFQSFNLNLLFPQTLILIHFRLDMTDPCDRCPAKLPW